MPARSQLLNTCLPQDEEFSSEDEEGGSNGNNGLRGDGDHKPQPRSPEEQLTDDLKFLAHRLAEQWIDKAAFGEHCSCGPPPHRH
eukprot:SAG22_NODE_450_length_10398_cov_8.760171_12_plen_85_part_00